MAHISNRRHLRMLRVAFLCTVIAACGDQEASDGEAQLNLSVRWEGFGEPFPAPVGRVGINLNALDSDFSCCIALDPSVGRSVVLTNLPPGDMNVHVAGFVGAVSFVGTAGGSIPLCDVKQPEGLGEACEPEACVLPSFDAPTQTVHLEPGRENNTGMIIETPMPAVFDAVSLCDESIDSNPFPLAVTVAVPNNICTCGDAVSFCGDNPADISVEAIQLNTDPQSPSCENLEPGPNDRRTLLDSVCCVDRPGCAPRGDGSPCCTADGERSLAGVRVDDVIASLQPGCVRFQITLQDFPSGMQVFNYTTLLTAVGPSPTPTGTPTPSPTGTDTPTFTPTVTPTDTPTSTPSITPTDTVGPTNTIPGPILF